MVENYYHDVTDIIDVAYLQQIQDSLGGVAKITTAILDADGSPVTTPTNLNAFCSLCGQMQGEGALCSRTNAQLIRDNKRTQEAATVICPISGLKTAAVPIMVGEQFLGSWLVGQVRTEETDLAKVEQNALKAGLTLEEVRQNFAVLPLIPEEDFAAILRLLHVITKELVDLAEANQSLSYTNRELLATTNQLHRSNATMQDFMDLADIGIYVSDIKTGEILMHNNAYLDFIGKNEDQQTDLCGQTCFSQLGSQTWCNNCPRNRPFPTVSEENVNFSWEKYIDETKIWSRMNCRTIKWLDNSLAHMVTLYDITERKKQEEQVAHLAYFDQRLNVPNGMRLFLDLNERPSVMKYIICFDIQGLRKINDAYSREAGDLLIEAIRDWLHNLDGYNLTLYRLDGDSFAIVLMDNQERVMTLAQQIYNRFNRAWIITLNDINQQIFVGVSIGVIPYEAPFENYPILINNLERILAAARDNGGPLLYSAEVDAAFRRHLQLEFELKNSVLSNMKGFSLCYQPIVNTDGKWVGLEALCRWASPIMGAVPPNMFIAEAEQLGLIDPIGEWVLEEAVAQAIDWGLDKVEDFILNINLSPFQLNDPLLHIKLLNIVKKYNYPLDKLSLEVTESAEVHFDDHIITSLDRLRAAGISLALDDFGTGYASFASLNQLPVSILKTDRSFMQDLEQVEYLQSTMRIMTDFAHAAGMQVIAEGVETEAQASILRKLNIDFMQGYFFSRPLTVEQMGEHLGKFC